MQKSPALIRSGRLLLYSNSPKTSSHEGGWIHRPAECHISAHELRQNSLLARSRQLDHRRPKRRAMRDCRRPTDGAFRIGSERHVERTGRP
jgi:hypothetical protein